MDLKATRHQLDICWERGTHRYRPFPARAAGIAIDGVPVISQKKCVDCKVTRSELQNNTVRYWWSQRDGRWGD